MEGVETQKEEIRKQLIEGITNGQDILVLHDLCNQYEQLGGDPFSLI